LIVISATSDGFAFDEGVPGLGWNMPLRKFDEILVDPTTDIITVKNGDEIQEQYHIFEFHKEKHKSVIDNRGLSKHNAAKDYRFRAYCC